MDIGGETLHHVAGVNPFSNQCSDGSFKEASRKVAERVSEMRWLIIDEVSMISAGLLAQVDRKLRDAMREKGTWKLDRAGNVRPFGGINVLFLGDFYQLPPPDGASLTTIPRRLLCTKRASVAGDREHGLELFWGRGEGSVQDVTILKQPQRCKDPWWNEVLAQCREMRLSKDNHNFLHGESTTVPGSWCDGVPLCGKEECEKLWQEQQKECSTCREHRQKRHRVLTESAKKHLRQNPAAEVPVIVANNDVKADLNKRRARYWARLRRKGMCWVYARDVASAEALASEPDLLHKKREWLKRHDRECGNLCSMLPLVAGMPVTLTDHIDRNPQKNLLRGRRGYIHSWVYAEDEATRPTHGHALLQRMPQVIYVRFKDAKWPKLKGTAQQGLYPIRPVARPWYLDQHRPVPKLKVTRRQFPLIPAFAMTAHAAQGKTLEKAIVDLCIGEDASALTGYVALSRVRDKESIWIFRPFPLSVFQQSQTLGPHLRLDHLQGKDIDWEALKKKLEPKECAAEEAHCKDAQPRRQAKRKTRGDEKHSSDDASEDSSQSPERPKQIRRTDGMDAGRRRGSREVRERHCPCGETQASLFARDNYTKCRRCCGRGGRALHARRCPCGETQASEFARGNFTKCKSCCVADARAEKKCIGLGCEESRWEYFAVNNHTLCKRCAGKKRRGQARDAEARKK